MTLTARFSDLPQYVLLHAWIMRAVASLCRLFVARLHIPLVSLDDFDKTECPRLKFHHIPSLSEA